MEDSSNEADKYYRNRIRKVLDSQEWIKPSILQLLQSVQAIGRDIDKEGEVVCASVVTGGMHWSHSPEVCVDKVQMHSTCLHLCAHLCALGTRSAFPYSIHNVCTVLPRWFACAVVVVIWYSGLFLPNPFCEFLCVYFQVLLYKFIVKLIKHTNFPSCIFCLY